MAPEVYEMLLSRVKAHGYDLDRLQQTASLPSRHI
jgi:hypothetical protein